MALLQGTAGADFHENLVVLPSDLLVQKGTNSHVDSYSAFADNANAGHPGSPSSSSGSGLLEKLQKLGVTTVYCAGVAYDCAPPRLPPLLSLRHRRPRGRADACRAATTDCVGSTAADAAACGLLAYFIADCAAVVGPLRESAPKLAMDR